MVLHSSGEDYLKAILILQKNNGQSCSKAVTRRRFSHERQRPLSAPYRFGSRNGGKTL